MPRYAPAFERTVPGRPGWEWRSVSLQADGTSFILFLQAAPSFGKWKAFLMDGTVRGAARLARITEDATDGVMRRAVERGLLRRQLLPSTLLGFDEKAIRKGHRYATILTDIENGCVIDLVEERTKEAALQLLGQLPEGSTGSIQAVAMDMWPG